MEEFAGFDGELTLTRTLSLAEYASELAKSGRRSISGEPETLWIRSETFGMIRFPTFQLTPPTRQEVSRVLWSAPAAVISYIVEPDARHPQNTWLYVCQDPSYNIETLSKPARRDARRATRGLVIAPLEWPVLLDKGWRAFSDTLARLRLSNSSPADFGRCYERFSRNPCHQVIGAWKEDSLAAFMTLFVVDDWVEIEGSFFAEAHKGLCPSNGLAHYVLDHFLVQRRFRTVSYGTSSVQEENGKTGLHAYKTKVGFKAQPAHRIFVLHPLLHPFVNRLTLRGINTVLYFMPKDRRLKKAQGVLASLLGKRQLSEILENNHPVS
jgi:hypothetical protein